MSLDPELLKLYWTESGSNLDVDPMLADPASGDFHLQDISPLIDAGTVAVPDPPGLPAADYEGDPRIVGPNPDIGADESPVDMLTVIMEHFDSFVDEGTLEGTGRRLHNADRRLSAIRRGLERAARLLEGGESRRACAQLWSVYRRCDGERRPPDFVQGDSAPVLAEMIRTLMANVGCSRSD